MEPCNDYDVIWRSPLGMLGIYVNNNKLVRLDYLSSRYNARSSSSSFAGEVLSQLKSYFKNANFDFSLPVASQGTDYQKRVWAALKRIPKGRTLTYGELAEKIESGPRAVGNACRHNPVSIVVPCHRVVAANGAGGYSGSVSGVKLNRKLWLLEHEGAN